MNFKKSQNHRALLLTEGGGGVSQMLTIADEGGRGGVGTPVFG